MILDYKYVQKRQEFTLSYVTPGGGKKILKFPVSYFDSLIFDENGDRTNWDGRKCRFVKKPGRPGWLDEIYFIKNLPESIQSELRKHNNPKIYTWDIETQFDPTEFPNPETAKFPVTCISIVNPNLDILELGTRKLDESEFGYVRDNIIAHLDDCEFYKTLNKQPTFRYLYFETEEEMLKYFLVSIVSKVAVLAGWNSDGFDYQYVQNRIINNYPELYMAMGSATWTTTGKNFTDKRGTKVKLNKPDHTWLVDLMSVVENQDLTFGPKESMTLDYISNSCLGIGKVEYDGDLEKLRMTDYKRYIYYSAIDSVLVQLIAQRRKILENLFSQALYCRTKISNAVSKIALSEAVFFNYFTDNGIEVVDEDISDRERGQLVGAYVRVPSPGRRHWVACNDFASLYPSILITTNMSPESYIGSVMEGTIKEEDLDGYRKNPDYFVSVNGSVYKNDKDYTFKNIQLQLKKDRGRSKYLSKDIDAHLLDDIESILRNEQPQNQEYTKDVIEEMARDGYNIRCTDDLKGLDLGSLRTHINIKVSNLVSFEQGLKCVMNSLYGASSHPAFFWYNMYLAGDITAEGQWLIHKMEFHIPCFMQEHWKELKEVHKKLGVRVK